MKKFNTPFILACLLVPLSCMSLTKKDQTLNLSGAFAIYPLAVQWSEEYRKVHPEIRFNISAGGAGKGMADALAGTVDLGMFSREITQEEMDRGVWWVGLAIDAVLPTISADNPWLEVLRRRGLTREELAAVFIDGRITGWTSLLGAGPDKQIVVYTRSDACGAAGTWAQYLGGMQEDIRGIGIYGDPGLAEAVSKDPMGIGFNNTIYIYDNTSGMKRPGMEVVPIDLNGNGHIDEEEDFYGTFTAVLEAIASGRYPSPPARELYFVSGGKPEKTAALDFLQWTLTEGQGFVSKAGYVPLGQDRITGYVEKLK